MLKILNSQSKSVTGAAILIAITTLLSRVVGIARDRTFAHFFGAGPTMDAYYAAFRIPDLIYNLLIAGALTAGFIPTFTKLFYESEDKSKAWKLANNIITIVGSALAILGAFGAIFTPFIVKIIAPGFSGDQLEMVTSLTRIMLLSPFFLGISMVIGGILQSLRQFTLYSIAPIFYNLGIMAGAIFLVPLLGYTGLAWGVVLGAFLHLLVQIFGASYNKYHWRWHFDLKDPSTILIGKLMIPRTIGLAISQFNTLIVTALASLLSVGSVSVFYFANNLQAVPTGLIGIPFAIAVFPLLSQKALLADREEFGQQVSNTARQILFLIAPLSICFLLLRAQIVRVVLGSGAFDWGATISTANALAFFSLGLLAQSLIPLLARSFYALGNTKTPFAIGVTSEVVSIALAFFLMNIKICDTGCSRFGVSGLALATSIGVTINAILLLIWLQKKVGNIFNLSFLTFILKIAAAGLFMGIVVQLLKYPLARVFDQSYFWGILSQGLFAGLAGLLAYGGLCRAMNVEEMLHLQASLTKRWLKLRNIREGIDEAEKL